MLVEVIVKKKTYYSGIIEDYELYTYLRRSLVIDKALEVMGILVKEESYELPEVIIKVLGDN